jgi:hypothetical protein
MPREPAGAALGAQELRPLARWHMPPRAMTSGVRLDRGIPTECTTVASQEKGPATIAARATAAARAAAHAAQGGDRAMSRVSDRLCMVPIG